MRYPAREYEVESSKSSFGSDPTTNDHFDLDKPVIHMRMFEEEKYNPSRIIQNEIASAGDESISILLSFNEGLPLPLFSERKEES